MSSVLIMKFALLSEWKRKIRWKIRLRCNLTRLTFWSVVAFPRNFNTRRSIPGISIHPSPPRILWYPSFFRLARPSSFSPDRLSSRRKYYNGIYSGSTNRQSSYFPLLLSDSSKLGSLILSLLRFLLAIKGNFEDSFPERIRGSGINYAVVTMRSAATDVMARRKRGKGMALSGVR